MNRDSFIEKGLNFADKALAPIAAVKAAHKSPATAKSFDKPWEDTEVTAPFPPKDVNSYDEYIGQLHNAHPELAPYVDTLYDMVQTPNDIERGLGMVALILDRSDDAI